MQIDLKKIKVPTGCILSVGAVPTENLSPMLKLLKTWEHFKGMKRGLFLNLATQFASSPLTTLLVRPRPQRAYVILEHSLKWEV